MSFRGTLLRSGIDSDGIDVTFYRSDGVVTFAGNVVFEGDLEITGDVEFTGGFTLGDTLADTTILNSRFVTGVAAGSALDVDASVYQYSEGIELRYSVSNWDDTYTLTSFRGMYIRAENIVAAGSNSIYGMECYGVANAKNTGQVWGALFYGYVKGSAAVVVKKLYGIQTEVSWDAGGSQDTLSTEATPILAKVTSGNINDYTKIHGMIIRMADMDGGSRTYGSGIKIEDDADTAGTSVFTYGLNIPIACITGILLAGAMTTGVNISGACTTAINVSAVQTDETGLDAAAVFQHGTYSTALAYGTQADFLILKSMHVTAAATGTYVFGDVNYIATSADSTGYIHVGYNYLSVGHALANGYATRSRLAITAACELGEQVACLATMEVGAFAMTGAGDLRAGLFELNIASGAEIATEAHCIEVRPLVAANVAGVTSGIRININCSSPNYVDFGLDIRSMSAQQTAAIRILATPNENALLCGIYLEGQDSATAVITNAISFAGGITNVLDFAEEDGSQGCTTAVGAVGTPTHKIAIDVKGTMRYLVVYDDIASGE